MWIKEAGHILLLSMQTDDHKTMKIIMQVPELELTLIFPAIIIRNRMPGLQPALQSGVNTNRDSLVQYLLDDLLNQGGFRVEANFLTVLESGSAERCGGHYKVGGFIGMSMRRQEGLGYSDNDRATQGDTHMTSVWVQWGPGGVTFKLWMVSKSTLGRVFRH